MCIVKEEIKMRTIVEGNIKGVGKILSQEMHPLGHITIDQILSAITRKGWFTLNQPSCFEHDRHLRGRLISSEELALARIMTGPDHSLTKNTSYVKEGILYIPNSKHRRVLVRDSLVNENPQQACYQNEIHKEFALRESPDDILERIGSDNYFLMDDTRNVPTNRFGDSGALTFLLGTHAQNYGLFLRDELGRPYMHFSFEQDIVYGLPGEWDAHVPGGIDGQRYPFARQLDFDLNFTDSGTRLYLGDRTRWIQTSEDCLEVVQERDQEKKKLKSYSDIVTTLIGDRKDDLPPNGWLGKRWRT